MQGNLAFSNGEGGSNDHRNSLVAALHAHDNQDSQIKIAWTPWALSLQAFLSLATIFANKTTSPVD